MIIPTPEVEADDGAFLYRVGDFERWFNHGMEIRFKVTSIEERPIAGYVQGDTEPVWLMMDREGHVWWCGHRSADPVPLDTWVNVHGSNDGVWIFS